VVARGVVTSLILVPALLVAEVPNDEESRTHTRQLPSLIGTWQCAFGASVVQKLNSRHWHKDASQILNHRGTEDAESSGTGIKTLPSFSKHKNASLFFEIFSSLWDS
jgi:hypothetical protein